jgi:predicted lipid-binding transport protein (Tim44 family)
MNRLTPRKRRIALIVLITLAVALIVAPVAFAGAGSGSSGFGGGDGGGGGGGGGGKGFFIYIIFRAILDLILFTHGVTRIIVIAFIVGLIAYFYFGPRLRRWYASQQDKGHAAKRQTAKRERKVELAAAEAADEDPMFSPDNVRAAGNRLFTEIQAAWSSDDRIRLRGLVAPELLAEWERRLDDFERRGWQNHVEIVGEPNVTYVGLSRTGRELEDRVVVRIDAKLRDYVVDRAGHHIKRAGRPTESVRTREFWTLGKRAGHWVLTSIEQGAEGSHAISEHVVATPWSDDQGLRDQAMTEQAVADAVPDGVKVAEVADLDFTGDARAAALDLSLADGRFAPDLLEIAARRAVAAWSRAIDGADKDLLAVATPEATQSMLHPGDPSGRTRLVVRGPQIKQIRIVALDAAAEPPTMTIDVEIKGRRYVEDRSTTAILSGSRSREVEFNEHWTLALDGDDQQPWRIVAVGEPVARA